MVKGMVLESYGSCLNKDNEVDRMVIDFLQGIEEAISTSNVDPISFSTATSAISNPDPVPAKSQYYVNPLRQFKMKC